MANASDYPVTHPFGATYKPWNKQNPHTGEDRGHRITKLMPPGTPINVGNTIIGLSGATGNVNGAHLHVQKFKGGYLNPAGAGLADTIALPATVAETGNKSDTGLFVRIIDNEGVRWSYFHLSEIKVQKGQIITGAKKMDRASAEILVDSIDLGMGTGQEKYGWKRDPKSREYWITEIMARPAAAAGFAQANYKSEENQQLRHRANNLESGYPALVKEVEELKKGSGEFVETKVYVKKGK